MKCKNCGNSDCTLIKHTSQLLAFSDFKDSEGHYHNHDENKSWQTWHCPACEKEFSHPYYNYCWCGWSSQYLDKIFHTPHSSEYIPKKWGFGPMGICLTNKEWIENLVEKIKDPS
jgi:hypothetical protein